MRTHWLEYQRQIAARFDVQHRDPTRSHELMRRHALPGIERSQESMYMTLQSRATDYASRAGS